MLMKGLYYSQPVQLELELEQQEIIRKINLAKYFFLETHE